MLRIIGKTLRKDLPHTLVTVFSLKRQERTGRDRGWVRRVYLCGSKHIEG